VQTPAEQRTTGSILRGWRLTPPTVVAFVLIPVLIEAVGVYWPMIQGAMVSFTRWNGITPPTPVGIGNYTQLFSDQVFLQALANTALWTLLFGGLSFVLGLLVALLLAPERRGVGIYRLALFLPVVFSFVLSGVMWSAIFQPEGLLNTVLRSLGLGGLTQLWLGQPSTALYAAMVAALWREVGYIMVLFIAGLKVIDTECLEAARVDGANALQRFWHVVFPQLRPVTLVVLCVIVIDSLRSFDIVWTMTGGGPYHSSELLSTFAFSQAFHSRALGYASAAALVILVIAAGVIITYLTRALSEEKSE